MDILRLYYKSNVILIYRDSVETSYIAFLGWSVGKSVSKKIQGIVWGSFNEIKKIKVDTVH